MLDRHEVFFCSSALRFETPYVHCPENSEGVTHLSTLIVSLKHVRDLSYCLNDFRGSYTGITKFCSCLQTQVIGGMIAILNVAYEARVVPYVWNNKKLRFLQFFRLFAGFMRRIRSISPAMGAVASLMFCAQLRLRTYLTTSPPGRTFVE